MQVVRRSPTMPGRLLATNRVGRRNNGLGLRARLACTCAGRPGSAKCARHGYMVPSCEKVTRRASEGSREILRRALAPPQRKITLRCWNFRPTPSRLSNMSSA